MKKPLVLLSGGFDPFHDGHAKMFEQAAAIGDICVILNSDDWLVHKKGRYFMNVEERSKVLYAIKGVQMVWLASTLTDVNNDLYKIKQSFSERLLIFGKGGDRNITNTPERETCESLEIPIIFGLGGDNQQSSSKILNRYNSRVDV